MDLQLPPLEHPLDGLRLGLSLRMNLKEVGRIHGLPTCPRRWQVTDGSNTNGRNKRGDVGSVVNLCDSQRRIARSIIASGAAEAVWTQRTTRS